MASSNTTDRLNNAIELARNGQTTEARAILRELLREDPNLELAWMWLATVAETPQERVRSLQNAVRVNPNNEKARAALQTLGSTEPVPASVPPPEIPLEPLADSGGRGFPVNALIVILIVIVAVGALILLGTAVGKALYRPTETPTSTPTATATLAISLTPSETPGGPSDTPVVPISPPPTWTSQPSATAQPSNTPAPTFTSGPSITPFNTYTPVPSDTLVPSTTPYMSPTPYLSPTASPTSDITPSGSETATNTPTNPPTNPPLPGGNFLNATTVGSQTPTSQ